MRDRARLFAPNTRPSDTRQRSKVFQTMTTVRRLSTRHLERADRTEPGRSVGCTYSSADPPDSRTSFERGVGDETGAPKSRAGRTALGVQPTAPERVHSAPNAGVWLAAHRPVVERGRIEHLKVGEGAARLLKRSASLSRFSCLVSACWPVLPAASRSMQPGSVADLHEEVLAACHRIDVEVGNCVHAFVEVGGAFQAVVLAGFGVDADGEVEGGVAASEGSLLDPADDLPPPAF